MGDTQRIQVTRWAALAALSASAALLVFYLHPTPGLCGFDSDCDDVLFSPFGRPLGVPLPVVGIVTFGTLFSLSLSSAPRLGRLFQVLALASGAGGLALVLIQVFVIHHVCPYCMIVDSAAVVLAVAEMSRGWGRPLPGLTRRGRGLWLGAAAAVLGLTVTLGAVAGRWADRTGGTVPPEVTALWVPDKVNVVEVVDFQCPYCRQMHAVLMQALREQGDRVHFVRLTAPMPKHPQAREASRAFLCAEQQGKGEQMAEKLFAADDLSPASCERLAASLDLSMPAYRACVADSATDQRLDADLAWVQSASPRGLPVIWVQQVRLTPADLGWKPLETLRSVLSAAEQPR